MIQMYQDNPKANTQKNKKEEWYMVRSNAYTHAWRETRKMRDVGRKQAGYVVNVFHLPKLG